MPIGDKKVLETTRFWSEGDQFDKRRIVQICRSLYILCVYNVSLNIQCIVLVCLKKTKNPINPIKKISLPELTKKLTK